MSSSRPLNVHDVERMTRDVLDGMGVPVPRTLAVMATDDGWQLVIEDATGLPQCVDLPFGRPVDLREVLITWAEGVS